MRYVWEEAGYRDAVLQSCEDFEPYGFVSRRLAPVVPSGIQRGLRRPVFDRVIEAELLQQSSFVGC